MELERLSEALRRLVEQAERSGVRGEARVELCWGRDGQISGRLLGVLDHLLRESA